MTDAPCQRCSGEGKVKSPAGDLEPCPQCRNLCGFCRGRGKVWLVGWATCPACRGTGEIEVEG